jgi:hypothetical protein
MHVFVLYVRVHACMYLQQINLVLAERFLLLVKLKKI